MTDQSHDPIIRSNLPQPIPRSPAWLPYAVIAVLGLFTGFNELTQGRSMLESKPFAWALLWFVEMLLTIPHELGHAVAAKSFGLSNVRIVIGFGRPMFAFDLLGFRWILNAFPIGGFTFLGNSPRLTRAKYALIIAAGPGVSAIAILLTWFFFGWQDDWLSISQFSGIFVWANAIVLALSLIPYRGQVAGGVTPNDGLLLLQLAFPRRIGPRTKTKARTQSAGSALKNVIAIILSMLALCLLVLGIFVLINYADITSLAFGGGLIALAIFLIFATYRLTGEKFITNPQPTERSLIKAGGEEFAALSDGLKDQLWTEKAADIFLQPDNEIKINFIHELVQKFPRDSYMLYLKAYYQWNAGRPNDALDTLGLIDPTALPRLTNFTLDATRLQFLISADHLAAAEALCDQWFQSDSSLDEKIEMIEALVSYHLYFEKLQNLDHLEQWIRRALALAPDDPSVKATLGGILVEQHRYAEAEPLLLPRIESAPNRQNQAYALFYVACIRIAQGKLREARNMIELATTFSDVEWLERRAAKKLEEIEKYGASKAVS